MNKLTKFIALLLIVFMLPVFAADETPVDPPAADQSQTESGNTDTPTEPTVPDEPAEPGEPTEPDEPVSKTAQDYADQIIAYYSSNPELSSWWDVVALYGAGADLEDFTLPEWTTESLNEESAVTDYAGIIFALIATGENVHDIWGRDIADELAKMQDPETGLFGSYPNQQIYSILALDAAKEPYNRDAALTALIDTFRADNGAFGYLPWDPSAEPVISPDIDLTAMALLVLDSESHSEIITSAVDFLAVSQLKNGGFASLDAFYALYDEKCRELSDRIPSFSSNFFPISAFFSRCLKIISFSSGSSRYSICCSIALPICSLEIPFCNSFCSISLRLHFSI